MNRSVGMDYSTLEGSVTEACKLHAFVFWWGVRVNFCGFSLTRGTLQVVVA